MARQQTEAPKQRETVVTILDARLSYGWIFETNKNEDDNGNQTESWSSTFLVDKKKFKNGTAMAVYMGKRMPLSEALKKAGDAARRQKWGDDPKKWPKLPPEKTFFRDGDYKSDTDGYEGHFYAAARSQLTEPPQRLTNRKDKASGKWIEAEAGGTNAPYSGCYVNGVIDLWAQDHKKYGKRMNAKLICVQFLRDGDPFGRTRIDVNDYLDDDAVGEEGSIGDDFDQNLEDEDDDDTGLV